MAEAAIASPQWLKNKPQPLPAAQPKVIVPGLSLVTPQSRKGTGPGIVVLVNESAQGHWIDDGVPSILMKWAEEGYCVAEIFKTAWEHDSHPIERAVQELANLSAFESSTGVGLVSYDETLLNRASKSVQSAGIKAVVSYGSLDKHNSEGALRNVPVLQHIPTAHSNVKGPSGSPHIHFYNDHKSAFFATPRLPEFHYATEAISHTRNLTFLKKHMGGPYFDLEAIWDEHTYYEFEDRSVEYTMNTMVAEPYVNHVPTLTGGVGRKDLSDFYAKHFIFSNPDDAELELISRTTGIDRIVDEFIYKCTHDREIDWLLPGVPPTNLKIEIPMMAVVNIRGDRLYHEHIHWDHATALRQVGYLPEYLPVNVNLNVNGDAPKTNGRTPMLRLPAIGKDGAAKLRDRMAAPSNEMFSWGVSRDHGKI